MISNERRSPFGRNVHPDPKPKLPVEVLKSGELEVERKVFLLALKENARGQFLSIVENCRAGHNMIVVPSTGLEEFKRIFDQMTEASKQIPAKEGEDWNPGGNGASDSGTEPAA